MTLNTTLYSPIDNTTLHTTLSTHDDKETVTKHNNRSWKVVTRKNEEIKFKWEGTKKEVKLENIYTQIQELFVESFLERYKNLGHEDFGGNQREFLTKAIKEDVEELRKGKGRWLAGFSNKKVVVYQSLNTDDYALKKEIYIGMLCINPDKQGLGLGRQAIDAIKKEYPDAEIFSLDVRHKNKESIEFYTHLGFQTVSNTHHGYNPKYYLGMEYKVQNS